jgi:hypothetical protein
MLIESSESYTGTVSVVKCRTINICQNSPVNIVFVYEVETLRP